MQQYFNVCMPLFSNRVNGYFGTWSIPQFGRLVNINLIYVGSLNDAKTELDCMKLFHPEWQIDISSGGSPNGMNNYTFYDTFWEWESGNDTPSHSRQLCFSALYSQTNFSNDKWFDTYTNDTLNYYNSFYKEFEPYSANQGILITTHVLIGKNVSNIAIDETSITPGFRQARIYIESCVGYPNDVSYLDDEYRTFLNINRKKLQSYSLGSYWNENYPNNSNYANDYWSNSHYQKLKQIKQVWGPQPALFNCQECVTADD